MEKKENSRSCINVYTASFSNGLKVSSNDVKQVISATNNRAQLYAEQSKKYRDEAKEHRDNAKYYAEQNSDVTLDYISNVQLNLEQKIASKQPIGNYALIEEIPKSVGSLINDANYVDALSLKEAVDEVRLPEQSEQGGKFLKTDGTSCHWATVNGFNLFDTKISDKILTYEESIGWALQGSYVYKTAIAGIRYGYPDFYAKCLEEYNGATSTETINGVIIKVHSNGHKFYNIADKSAIDNSFSSLGTAWYYGVDTTNECIFLPRSNYVTSFVANGNKTVDVYGSGMTLGLTDGALKMGLSGVNDTQIVNRLYNQSSYGLATGSIPPSAMYVANAKTVGVTTDASKSGLTGNVNIQNSQTGMNLYICVGNTINYEGISDVISQGRDILEQVNLGISEIAQSVETRVKIDGSNASFPYVIENYSNGTSWYRVWSDGWCEQGGLGSTSFASAGTGTETITLLKPYKDTNYTATVNKVSTTTANSHTVSYSIKSNSQLILNNNGSIAGKISWRTCGYLI